MLNLGKGSDGCSGRFLTRQQGFGIPKKVASGAQPRYSSVAQWQSIRLLTEGL